MKNGTSISNFSERFQLNYPTFRAAGPYSPDGMV